MEAKTIIESVLKFSEADDCIVIIKRTQGKNLRWANSGLTTNGDTFDSFIVVISIFGKKSGTYAVSLDEELTVKDVVKKSEQIAKASPEAEDYLSLPKGNNEWSEVKSGRKADQDIDSLSEHLIKVFQKAKANSYELFGYTEHRQTEYFLGTSSGIREHFYGQQGQFELNGKTSDYAKSVWSGQSVSEFGQVEVNSHFDNITKKLRWSSAHIDLPAGKYEVILEPSAVADLMLFAYWDSSARQAEEGRSAYSSTKNGSVIGEKLYDDKISIYSDPTEPGLETIPFEVAYYSGDHSSVFDNGIQLEKTFWIKNGVQTNLISTRNTAKKYGYSKVSPFIPNLIFKSQGNDINTMIQSSKRALLVTTLWYIREVDPRKLLLTGLTRDGVFLIEDGEVKGAVNNFRFNMSPLQVLKNVVEIGQSTNSLAREFGDYFPYTHMPALRVKEFNMSSVSQAF